jgi:MOSC domain-containing protein YiiM
MNNMTVYSISICQERGQLKKEVSDANFIENFGIENDGHAGNWGRQVTCLSFQSVQKANRENNLNCGPGDFAENLLIDGMEFYDFEIGSRLKIAEDVILEVTQIGKEDHPSIVTKTFGVSLLPTEGLFCRVITGGKVTNGDPVEKL